MFSKTANYAIRALIYIHSVSIHEERVDLTSIAQKIGAPQYFMAKIMQKLVKAGLVSSIKGPHGGFYVTPKQHKVRAIEVISLFEDNEFLTGCALGLPYCSDSNPCPVHHQYASIRTQILNWLRNVSIRELGEKLKNGARIGL